MRAQRRKLSFCQFLIAKLGLQVKRVVYVCSGLLSSWQILSDWKSSLINLLGFFLLFLSFICTLFFLLEEALMGWSMCTRSAKSWRGLVLTSFRPSWALCRILTVRNLGMCADTVHACCCCQCYSINWSCQCDFLSAVLGKCYKGWGEGLVACLTGTSSSLLSL